MKALLVYRAPQYSPNAVVKDRAVLEETGHNLLLQGVDIQYIDEERLTDCLNTDMILTMGRLPQTQERLAEAEEKGIPVINSAQALMHSSRGEIDQIMRSNAIPAPLLWRGWGRSPFSSGCWAKRADITAQCKDDVQFAADEHELHSVLASFKARGVGKVLVTEHVVGDLVKFYGVLGTGFFRMFYPTDDGQTKFDDELRNGQAHHYGFDSDSLQRDAEKLSRLLGIAIYGGDCIVRADGSYVFIDFNDWPSFSRCRQEAAQAIALYALNIVNGSVRRCTTTPQTSIIT